MPNTVDNYNDDQAVREALASVDSERTLHEFYAYFFGCMAAPNAALPSQCLPLLFDADKADFSSLEHADNLMANLMSLWSFIARWNPEEEPGYFPETDYPETGAGLKQRTDDDQAMIQFFIRGLDQGGTKENDFSDDAIDAMHDLEDSAILLRKYAELYANKGPDLPLDDPGKVVALYDELEDVIADSIARITIGLKEAKVRAARKIAAVAKAGSRARTSPESRRR